MELQVHDQAVSAPPTSAPDDRQTEEWSYPPARYIQTYMHYGAF